MPTYRAQLATTVPHWHDGVRGVIGALTGEFPIADCGPQR